MSVPISFQNPDTVIAPYGPYSHVASVTAGSTMLFLSGQVGENADGLAIGVENQYRVALENIRNILQSQGASPNNIVKLTTYVTETIPPAELRKIRGAVFGEIAPAATMLPLPRLAAEGYFVEIDVVAAL